MKTGDTIEHNYFGRGKIIKEIFLQPDLKPALLAIDDSLGLVPLENFIVCFKVDFESRTSVFIFTKDTLESKAVVVDGGVDGDVEKQPQFEKGNPVYHRRLGPGIVLDFTNIDNVFYYQVQFENGHLSPYPGVAENNLHPLPNRSTDTKETTVKSNENTVRPALSIEEIKTRLHELLIQQRDVDGTCQFLNDAVMDRKGDRTEKERDYSTLKRVEIDHREKFFRMQNQLVEYFGIKLEDVIENRYRKNDDAENAMNIDDSISPLSGLGKTPSPWGNEDPTFLATYLNKLPIFDSILIEHLKHLRENHPIFFNCVSGAYQQLTNKSLEGKMDESSTDATEPPVDEEDANFLAIFLGHLVKFDDGLIERLKQLRRNRPRYFDHVKRVYQDFIGGTLDEIIDASSNVSEEECEESEVTSLYYALDEKRQMVILDEDITTNQPVSVQPRSPRLKSHDRIRLLVMRRHRSNQLEIRVVTAHRGANMSWGELKYSKFTDSIIPLTSKWIDQQFLIDFAVAREDGTLVSPEEFDDNDEEQKTEVSFDYVVDAASGDLVEASQFSLGYTEVMADPRWKRITLKKGEEGRYFVIVELKHVNRHPNEPDSATYSMDKPIEISLSNALRWAGMYEHGEIPRSVADDKFY